METSTQLIASITILKNYWFGRHYVKNTLAEIQLSWPAIGTLLTELLFYETDGLLERRGKASLVGVGEEMEHVQAMTHTPHFGNRLCLAIGAKSYLSFSNKRSAANCAITILLMDKHDAGRRSQRQTFQTSTVDVPDDDKILVALETFISGRPNHRIGDRYKDLKELSHNIDNPAGV